MFLAYFFDEELGRRWVEGIFHKCHPPPKLRGWGTQRYPPTVARENFPRNFRTEKIDLPIWQTPS